MPNTIIYETNGLSGPNFPRRQDDNPCRDGWELILDVVISMFPTIDHHLSMIEPHGSHIDGTLNAIIIAESDQEAKLSLENIL